MDETTNVASVEAERYEEENVVSFKPMADDGNEKITLTGQMRTRHWVDMHCSKS
jgi:hypothetical protein